MDKVAQNMLELVCNTPIVKLQRVAAGLPVEIWAKVEFLNPSGSLKDRIALDMISEAERRGDLRPGMTIIEATSGNTGIAFSMAAAVKGYQIIIVMPEEMSDERKQIMSALGAKLVLTPGGSDDVPLSRQKVTEMCAGNPDLWFAGQFSNPDNVASHRNRTGPEIWAQTDGRVDAIVQGVGTGGSLSGVAQYFKMRNPAVRIVAVEPAACPIISGGKKCGPHQIEGIGDGFIPENLDLSVIDEVVSVPDEEAIAMTRRLMREEGILGGTSSGANVWASLQVAKTMTNGVIVTFIPDTCQRYFSTGLFPEPNLA